jgi:integrase
MKGSITREANGTWTWFFGYTGHDGKRRQPKGRGYPTKKAAETALRERLRVFDRGGPVTEPSRELLGRYLEAWHERRRTQLRPESWRREGYTVRDVVGVIGHVPLCQVRAEHVEAVMTSLSKRGQAPASVNKCRGMLSTCFAQAVKRGHLAANPVSATERLKVERRELVVPDGAGLAGLQQAAAGTPWEIPMLLATTLGTRRGETLGPAWEHVDLDTGKVRIVRAVQRIDGKLRLVEPKTARARRSLVLPASALARLRTWKVEQAQAMLRLGVRQTPATLVCANPIGEPLDPDSFTKAARRFAKAAGLVGARLHDSRHGVATSLLAQGVHPGIAAAVLGHTDPGFTLRVYSHVLDGMADQAAEAMERALGSA